MARNNSSNGYGGITKASMGSRANSTKSSNVTSLPVQEISQSQIKDKREKGLCYYCDSKWVVGHKCKNPKLFLIEEIMEEFPVWMKVMGMGKS